jgi:hypothetical protein
VDDRHLVRRVLRRERRRRSTPRNALRFRVYGAAMTRFLMRFDADLAKRLATATATVRA